MEWLAQNWFFILFFVLFVAMHMGHGGHGGHGGHRRRPADQADDDPRTRDVSSAPRGAGNESRHDHGA